MSAFLEIRDRRLYRLTHGSFAEYTQERWGFTRQRAHQMIEAANITRDLSRILDTPAPSNVGQTEALARVEPEQRAAVWQAATEKAKAEERLVTPRAVGAPALRFAKAPPASAWKNSRTFMRWAHENAIDPYLP